MGYKAEGKELSIDTGSTGAIKTIFSLREKGYSLREIADFLNSNNVAMATGGKWYAATVKYILGNTIYKGILEYYSLRVIRKELALMEV